MKARPLDLLDLPRLYRLRKQAVVTDSLARLVDGPPLRSEQLLRSALPGRDLVGAVVEHPGWHVAGMRRSRSGRLAVLTFLLAPDAAVLPALLNVLASQAFEWQTHFLLAEPLAGSGLTELLRGHGFQGWCWQQHYICLNKYSGQDWRPATDRDEIAVRRLQRQYIPRMLRLLEVPDPTAGHWLLVRRGEVLGYAECLSGPNGLLVRPLLRPDLPDPHAALAALIGAVRQDWSGPLYLRIRSWQSWLQPFAEDLAQPLGEREPVLVRPLLARQLLENKKFAHQAGMVIPTGW